MKQAEKLSERGRIINGLRWRCGIGVSAKTPRLTQNLGFGCRLFTVFGGNGGQGITDVGDELGKTETSTLEDGT